MKVYGHIMVAHNGNIMGSLLSFDSYVFFFTSHIFPKNTCISKKGKMCINQRNKREVIMKERGRSTSLAISHGFLEKPLLLR